jgi:hypothetical protein
MNKPFEGILTQRALPGFPHPQPQQSAYGAPTRTDLGALGDFRVRLVRTESQLEQAVQIRAFAYSRHHPELTQLVRSSESSDRHPDSIVLLAESRSTGEPEGTVRIQTNLREPSEFETHLALPEKFRRTTIAHVSRLAVRPSHRPGLVKVSLFKSLYRYCLATQIRWLMVGARPPMDRQFVSLGFEDVFDREDLVLLPSTGDIPVRVLAFDVVGAERKWRELGHRFYSYMFLEYTPDIEVFESVSGMWSRPRESRGQGRMAVQSDDVSIPVV